METIQKKKFAGLTGAALRVFGLLFVVLGIAGKGVIQTRLLGLGQLSGQQLLQLLESSPDMMSLATAGIVMEALETCAVPIFAFLAAEGVIHTKDYKLYLLRVMGLALLSELPYNLAFSGHLLDFSGRNPVFGVALALILMGFYGKYAGLTLKNILMKILVTLCALVWAIMLKVEYGIITIAIAAVLWALRGKPNIRCMAGAAVTILCSMGSMLFMAAPMGCLIIFLYNGEQGEQNRTVNYLAYPVLLLVVALAGAVLL